MIKKIFLMTCIATVALTGCKPKQTADTQPITIGDNARAGVDWAGTYIGVIPCADCSGIDTRVTLNRDGAFTMSQRYEGREGVFDEKGTFTWSALGNSVTFNGLSDNTKVRFLVSEGKITMLNQEGNQITGELADNYVLTKVHPALLGKKWKLSELAGKAVDARPEAYIILDAAGSSVGGNLGCNDFTGSYELKSGNRIKFSRLVVTQKMCLNMEIEDGLKKMFDMADNYSIADSKLILNRARMAPLAVFVLAE
jgi:heat shock protein HslJ